MLPASLAAFVPDADALLRRICAHVDDAMLLEIAEADYGQGVDHHLTPIRALRNRQQVPVLDWHPREVLELIRWSEPDQAGWRPGGQGTRGHWMRAFACATLLRAYPVGDNAGHCHSTNETTVQLTQSLDRLATDLDLEAASFFAWCIGAYAELNDGREQAFFGLALLWSACRLPHVPDGVIVELCQWIEAEAERAAALAGARANGGRWLLSTNLHNQRNGAWEEFGRELLSRDMLGRGTNASEGVRLIGLALAAEAT